MSRLDTNPYFCSKLIIPLKPESEYTDYMRRCLELAGRGLGRTRQNPLVGSVIVYNNRIIGEGYHREFGGPHAEVNAIKSVRDKALLKKSTLYVNLEPCVHYGKTPPCSLLIRQSGIPKVVVGSIDPHDKVGGKGIQSLKEAGVEVITEVLSDECDHLNRRFFTWIRERRPYVVLKWAQSRDAYLDRIRRPEEPQGPNWITNETARMLVHKWRTEETGIMAGVRTVLNDNPKLNVRNWIGENPVRIIVDMKDRINEKYSVKDGSLPTLIFSTRDGKVGNTEYISADRSIRLADILHILAEKGMVSLMVEGGALLLNSFIREELWDEARVFTGDVLFWEGVKAPEIHGKRSEKLIFAKSELSITLRTE